MGFACVKRFMRTRERACAKAHTAHTKRSLSSGDEFCAMCPLSVLCEMCVNVQQMYIYIIPASTPDMLVVGCVIGRACAPERDIKTAFMVHLKCGLMYALALKAKPALIESAVFDLW